MTSDRGLCGGFNTTIVREARTLIRRLQEDGKTVKIFCVGRKGRDNLRRDYASLIVNSMEDVGRRSLGFSDAEQISGRVLDMFDKGEFDVCTVIYNHFRSVISQVVTAQQLIPFSVETGAESDEQDESAADDSPRAVYEFEPDEQEILQVLLPRNLAVQIFHSLLENAASEHGARMTAMDNATRNAGEMIDGLTLTYNRTRQAFITKELIEIISGAEAL
jgi:F-type H+-transporting ATPase subunit gamma